MKCDVKFFRCRHCGNLVAVIENGGGELVCCGEPMQLLHANTVDASKEKHVPVIIKEKGKVIVQVGSVEHPMLKEHYIQWIYLCGKDGAQMKALKPGEKPEAVFYTADDGDEFTAYEYCNLHGLWAASI